MNNFNSIKVRLKRYVATAKLLNSLFQFHKGTIKTEQVANNMKVGQAFQFHKGTIKTYVATGKLLNSLFQFHKGTIKTTGHVEEHQ